MLLVFSILLLAVIVIKDDKIELYEHVTIEHGDTLWSLAEQYHGKMTKHDWVNIVKKENSLRDEKIVLGQIIVVPVEQDSHYIAKVNETSDVQLIKVASENNDRN